MGEFDDTVVGHAAEHRIPVRDLPGDPVQRQHAGRGGQRPDQRRGDAHPDREAFLGALGGHPVVGQLAEIPDEYPRAAAALLGQADRVHDDEPGQLGPHRAGQELQQVLGITGRVDDQDPGAVGGAAEEVDRLDDRLFDEHNPVGAGILVHEAVHDRGVAEPGVAADQAVGAVRVVYVVADVVGVEAEFPGRGRDTRGDVTRLLVHDDAARPHRELVIHSALPSIVYRRQDTDMLRLGPGCVKGYGPPGFREVATALTEDHPAAPEDHAMPPGGVAGLPRLEAERARQTRWRAWRPCPMMG